MMRVDEKAHHPHHFISSEEEAYTEQSPIIDSSRNLFDFRDAFTLLPKDHGIGQKVIEQAGNDQGCKITINHVPSENLLEQQQEQHLDQEAHSR